MSSVSPAQQFDLDDVSRLLEDVNKQVEALRSGDARAREAAVTSARALGTMLETPSEAIVRMTWNEVSLCSSSAMPCHCQNAIYILSGGVSTLVDPDVTDYG